MVRLICSIESLRQRRQISCFWLGIFFKNPVLQAASVFFKCLYTFMSRATFTGRVVLVLDYCADATMFGLSAG